MKKILLSCFLILAACTGHAQYRSVFGNNSTSWNIAWYNLDLAATDSVYTDSMVVYNSTTYHSIRASLHGNSMLLREDTTMGKVWCIRVVNCSDTDNVERLVLNMSMQVGDTFNIANTEYGYGSTDSLIVVDSVYFDSGMKHIRLKAPSTYYLTEPITFIEGIGPNYTLLWDQQCTVEGGKYLLCAYKDGVRQNYQNLRYSGDCAPLFTGVGDVKSSQVTISPNPASDMITVSGRDGNMLSYTVYDLAGRTQTVLSNENHIDVSSLSSGVYILRISGYQGSSSHMFIKE